MRVRFNAQIDEVYVDLFSEASVLWFKAFLSTALAGKKLEPLVLRLTRAASLYGFLIPYLSLSRLSHARVIGERCSIYARLMHLGTALFLTCPPVARTVVLFHVTRQVHLEHATVDELRLVHHFRLVICAHLLSSD